MLSVSLIIIIFYYSSHNRVIINESFKDLYVGTFSIIPMLRHGDLLIKQVDILPTGLVRLDTNILAFGEATGHNHSLVGGQATVYAAKGETEAKYVQVDEDSTLTHQEHDAIDVPEGQYEVVHEREYSPFDEAIKRVQD